MGMRGASEGVGVLNLWLFGGFYLFLNYVVRLDPNGLICIF